MWQDYLAIFRALHPECDALPLSRAQYRRLLPFATAIQTLAFFFFLLVEASGGAGGTSLVAGTRTVRERSLRRTEHQPSREETFLNYGRRTITVRRPERVRSKDLTCSKPNVQPDLPKPSAENCVHRLDVADSYGRPA